jgi:hypothetical protein
MWLGQSEAEFGLKTFKLSCLIEMEKKRKNSNCLETEHYTAIILINKNIEYNYLLQGINLVETIIMGWGPIYPYSDNLKR